ncbi:MAG: hypothetical protein KKF77_10870 [Proteobacteria bacterium]|nr:hypothetical protein [Pseudomonadota bacterium]
MTKVVEIPVCLLVRLLNTTADQDAKADFLAYALEKGGKDPRAHVLRGFCVNSDDELAFSEDLYELSVYHGKVGTHSKSMQEEAEKIVDRLELVRHMREERDAATERVTRQKGLSGVVPVHPHLLLEEEQAILAIRAAFVAAKMDMPQRRLPGEKRTRRAKPRDED